MFLVFYLISKYNIDIINYLIIKNKDFYKLYDFIMNLSKPIVWFDIDDVIFHLWPDLIKYYNIEYKTNKTLKDVWSLEWDKSYYIIEKYNLYKKMKWTEILYFLKQKRKDIYLILITARKYKYIDDTFWEIYEHWLDFDDIFMWEKKSEVCKLEKVDHFFDDALHNIIDIRKNSPNTIVNLVKRDWNCLEKLKKIDSSGLICNSDLKRLTEQEVCEVLKRI